MTENNLKLSYASKNYYSETTNIYLHTFRSKTYYYDKNFKYLQHQKTCTVALFQIKATFS